MDLWYSEEEIEVIDNLMITYGSSPTDNGTLRHALLHAYSNPNVKDVANTVMHILSTSPPSEPLQQQNLSNSWNNNRWTSISLQQQQTEEQCEYYTSFSGHQQLEGEDGWSVQVFEDEEYIQETSVIYSQNPFSFPQHSQLNQYFAMSDNRAPATRAVEQNVDQQQQQEPKH